MLLSQISTGKSQWAVLMLYSLLLHSCVSCNSSAITGKDNSFYQGRKKCHAFTVAKITYVRRYKKNPPKKY